MKYFGRKVFFTLLFLGLDFLLAGIIAELWTRNFIAVKNICYETDETIGVRFCPNQRTYGYVEKGYQNILETNSWGFHDQERRIERDPGTFRIQVYGDSMIQGYCVPTRETIPSQIEKFLKEQNPSCRVEVANLAPGEDGTSSLVLTYQKIGKKFNPDLVMLYFMDDFADNMIQLHRREFSPYHKLTASGELVLIPPIPKDFSKPWERFKKTSRLYRLLANKFLESKVYNDLKGLQGEIEHTLQGWLGQEKKGGKTYLDLRREICISESWPMTLRLISHFKDQVHANGGKFLLVDGQEFNDKTVGTKYKNKDLEEFCRRSGIAYVPAYTLYAEIRNSKEREKYLFLDNHMKVPGNRIMSLFLAEEIRKFIPAGNGRNDGERS
jgi:hypothetical protein